ncbi:MAG TPA: CoA pyrophosphatase [Anaerolineaceae bacterium]|nr:CoA pyrophosphatase [Anaerolineaceae bacterium]
MSSIVLPDDLGNRLLAFSSAQGVGLEYNFPKGTKPFRPAAVLMALLFRDGQWHLLYTHRAENLHDHSGQVSFPGGSREAQDENIIETALRESYEEVGVRPQDVQIIGQLPSLELVSFFEVTPVVGVIPWPYAFNISHDEVARLFTVPLDWLARPENLVYKDHQLMGSAIRVPYFAPYEGEVIWGATANMTVDLLKLL